MRKSLITSLVLHGAVLVAALIVLPNPDKFKVQPQDAIQVDISKLTDESKRKATSKTAEKPVEKAAPKKTEVVKKVEPAPKVAEEVKKAVKEAVVEPPPPQPKVEEPKKVEPKPLDPDSLKDLLKKVEEEPKPKEEVKKAEVKPAKKPEEKKQKKKKKPELNTDDIAAFLNKTDDEKAAPQQPAEVTAEPEQGVADILGADDALAATLADALRQKLAGCWSVPPGAREANITVKVRFFLNRDGSVVGQPEVLNGSGDTLFATTAQSAVSAVMECQRYDFFPPDRYDLWKDNTINFNPNMMFGT
jgi:outer membrane biosynthesis protein TonB